MSAIEIARQVVEASTTDELVEFADCFVRDPHATVEHPVMQKVFTVCEDSFSEEICGQVFSALFALTIKRLVVERKEVSKAV